MHKPSARVSRLAVAAATPIAVLAAAALVWQSSYAAFSGTTRNAGNDWATGTVALTDDDAGSARFQVDRMTPNDTESKCIKVTSNASVPGAIKLYAVNPVISAQGLEKHIMVEATSGEGGGFGSCNGYVPERSVIPANTTLRMLAASDSYANGLGEWTVPSGTSSRTYQITWRFDISGLSQTQVDLLQGARTGIDFQWELKSS